MGDLEVTQLLSLANSRHRSSPSPEAAGGARFSEHDDLSRPEDARAFLESEAVPVPPGLPSDDQLARLRAIRDLGHDILEVPDDRWRDRLAELAREHLFLFDREGRPTPAAGGWDGFVASLIPQLFELDRQRSQLRHCANPTCHWLFADRSKNHSRVWCDMGTCGSRAKMSRYRSRRRTGTAAGSS